MKLTTRQGVHYVIRRSLFPRELWFSRWLPKWHKGRGHYVTVGLWWIVFYRGY